MLQSKIIFNLRKMVTKNVFSKSVARIIKLQHEINDVVQGYEGAIGCYPQPATQFRMVS